MGKKDTASISKLDWYNERFDSSYRFIPIMHAGKGKFQVEADPICKMKAKRGHVHPSWLPSDKISKVHWIVIRIMAVASWQTIQRSNVKFLLVRKTTNSSFLLLSSPWFPDSKLWHALTLTNFSIWIALFASPSTSSSILTRPILAFFYFLFIFEVASDTRVLPPVFHSETFPAQADIRLDPSHLPAQSCLSQKRTSLILAPIPRWSRSFHTEGYIAAMRQTRSVTKKQRQREMDSPTTDSNG